MAIKTLIAEIELLCDRMIKALHDDSPEPVVEDIGQRLSEKYDHLEDRHPTDPDEALLALRFCLGEIENQAEDPSVTGQVVRIARKNADFLQQVLEQQRAASYLQMDGNDPATHTDPDRPD